MDVDVWVVFVVGMMSFDKRFIVGGDVWVDFIVVAFFGGGVNGVIVFFVCVGVGVLLNNVFVSFIFVLFVVCFGGWMDGWVGMFLNLLRNDFKLFFRVVVVAGRIGGGSFFGMIFDECVVWWCLNIKGFVLCDVFVVFFIWDLMVCMCVLVFVVVVAFRCVFFWYGFVSFASVFEMYWFSIFSDVFMLIFIVEGVMIFESICVFLFMSILILSVCCCFFMNLFFAFCSTNARAFGFNLLLVWCVIFVMVFKIKVLIVGLWICFFVILMSMFISVLVFWLFSFLSSSRI